MWKWMTAVAVMTLAAGCAYVPGDSTLYGAQRVVSIPGAAGFPGASPVDALPGVLARPGVKVMWVFVGSNVGGGEPGPADDVAAMLQARAAGHKTLVVLQGVVPEYDDAVRAAFTETEICDLVELGVAATIVRPDGIHPDEIGYVTLGNAVNDCGRRL